MAKQTVLTEAEYLRTSFESPEPDFVEGELIERAMPNNFHSAAQGELVHKLKSIRGLYVRPELRVLVRPEHYRVVDVAAYRERPRTAVPDAVPFIAAEILSPDDRMDEVFAKLEDYAAWGVPHVWLIRPSLQAIFVYRDRSLQSVEAFELPEIGERIPVSAIFEES